MFLLVKVVPKSSQNQIVGWQEQHLRIKVKGIPEEGKVNEELLFFLSTYFEIPKSAIRIITGLSSRIKRLFIEDQFEGKVRFKLMQISEG